MNAPQTPEDEATWRRKLAAAANNREDWEVALSHAVLAHAAHCAGDDSHAGAWERVSSLMEMAEQTEI